MSDGGIATYNEVTYEIQSFPILKTATGSFSFTCDTSNRLPGGKYTSKLVESSAVHHSVDDHGASLAVKLAIKSLENVDDVDVSQAPLLSYIF